MVSEDAPLLDHLATMGIQQAEVAVAVANVDAGGNVVVVGHGQRVLLPVWSAFWTYDLLLMSIVGSTRSIISAFSSHLDRGYAPIDRGRANADLSARTGGAVSPGDVPAGWLRNQALRLRRGPPCRRRRCN